MKLGDFYCVEGYNSWYSSRNAFFVNLYQDSTGGINIFSCSIDLKLGQKLE